MTVSGCVIRIIYSGSNSAENIQLNAQFEIV